MDFLPDRLIAADLMASLGQGIIGRRIIVLESTGSTNDFLHKMLTPGLPEGFVVFAEEQTAGRGQHGNRWVSTSHLGLWFSILLRPKIDIGDSPRLAEWAASTIAATISKEFALPASVKLPNDVIVAGKKVAGVLIEMRAQKNAPHIAIAGIGVNVNQRAEDFSEELRARAISLTIALDREIDRHQFAIGLLKNLDRTYADGFAR
jgi:BirA family biotin operon repressor/biotin-[acetyl-CoA-carboxylase] ligase